MSHDYFHSVYKVDGVYLNPYGVLDVLENTPEDRKQEVVNAIRLGGLDKNPNILKKIEQFEHDRDMSS
jgi:hypothetical protein